MIRKCILVHRDEVAGGAVGVQNLDGLTERDVAHRERSRQAGRRPNPEVVARQSGFGSR